MAEDISDWDWAMEAAALAGGVWFKAHPKEAEMFAIAMRAQKGDHNRDMIIASLKADEEKCRADVDRALFQLVETGQATKNEDGSFTLTEKGIKEAARLLDQMQRGDGEVD